MSQIPTTTTNPSATASPNPSNLTPENPMTTLAPTTTAPPSDQNPNPAHLTAAANAAPKLDPASTLGIAATASNPAEAAANAYMAQAYTRASIQAEILKGLGVDFQHTYWKAASPAEQALLSYAGYTPPSADLVSANADKGGWFHSLLHIADNVRHGASWVGAGLKDTFISAPGRAFGAAAAPITHLMRAGFENAQQAGLQAQENGSSQWSVDSILHTLDPLSILHAWGETANGASSFQPEVLRYVTKELGLNSSALAFAKTMASGVPLQQALASLPTAERGQAFALTQDEQFQKAVQLLSDGHLTLGQMVFGGLNKEQYDQMFPHADQGILDATSIGAQAATIAGAAATVAEDPASGMAFRSGVRGALGRAILGGGAAGITQGLVKGETPDQATAVAPFGIHVNPMSGLTDGVVSWYLNPLFQGLEGLNAYKSASRAAAVLDGMGQARDIPGYYQNVAEGRRFAQQFVKLVTTKSPGLDGVVDGVDRPNLYALDQYGIKTDGGAADLVQKFWPELKKAAAGEDGLTPEGVVGRMVAEGKGLVDFFMGKGAGIYHDETVLPHLPLSQKVLEDLKGIGSRALGGRRFAADKLSPRELADEVFGKGNTEDAFAQARAAVKEGPVARFKRRFTNLVASEPFIKFGDPNAATALTRFAAFALPDDMIGQFRNAWAAIPKWDDGARKNVLDSLVTAVFDAAHLGDTPDGQKFMDEFWQRQKYSAQEGAHYADPKNVTGPPRRLAFLTTQLADAYALPDFRQLLVFSKKNWLMSHLTAGIDAEGIDKFMSGFWKPLMLLRPGFALRFAGEEVLNFMLRDHGSIKWLQSLAAMTGERALNAEREGLINTIAANKDFGFSAEDIARLNMADARMLAKALTSHIPKEALLKIRDRYDLFGNIHGWNAIRMTRQAYWRAVLKSIAPESLLDAARELAKRGVYGSDSSFRDHIDAVTSHHGNIYFGDPVAGTRGSFLNAESGTPLRITGGGNFETYTEDSEDSERTPAWMWALGGIARDPFARAAMSGWARGGEDGMYQAVVDKITGRDLHMALDEAIRTTGDSGEGGVFTHPQTQKAQAAIEAHDHLVRRFAVNFQTKDGRPVTDAATARQSVHDWATTIVDHIKSLAFTNESQDEIKAEESQRNLLDNPQPIRLAEPRVPRVPIAIKEGDRQRLVTGADPETAYLGIPEGHVRLFHGQNTKTAQGVTKDEAPGRMWTPSHALAHNIAGEDGNVFSIDVPRERLASHYDFHGAEGVAAHDYAKGIHDANHPTEGKAGPPRTLRGTFESGNFVHARTTEPNQRLLIDELARGIVPGADDLARVDRTYWPDRILAEPQVAKIPPGQSVKSLIDGGMRRFVGRPANMLSRRPIFGYNFAVAWREAKSIIASRGIEDVNGDLAFDTAFAKAFDQTMPYIHDPATKSQFSLVTRNLMPFWFAQEQFYKRWFRLFANYPEAWYKLSQTMNGLKHVGFVSKDAYGNDAFIYPGSQAMLSFLQRFPFHAGLPIAVGLSSEIAQLNPSLTTGGAPIPAFGPIATVPMSVVGVMFPHTDGVVQSLLGPDAPQLNEGGMGWDHVIQQFFPSLVNRIIDWEAAPKGANAYIQSGSPLYHATSIMAAQYLESHGMGLTAEQEKNPRLVQQYLDRIANWTRNLLLIRAFFGFLAPGTPTFQFNDQGLGAQFQALISTMPYEEAVSAFIKAHPNATPDTIFGSTTSSKTGSGTYVPATDATGKFIDDNRAFFENYGQLAPWTIPAAAAKGTFSATTYQQEGNLGLRTTRDLNDWYDQLKYAEGANIYFPLDEAVKAARAGQMTAAQRLALANAGFGGGDKNALSHWWDEWKGSEASGTGFLGTHPLFAAQLTEPTASIRRAAIVSDLRQAISNSALPKGAWATQAEAMMVGFEQVQAYYDQTQGESGYATQRKQNKDAYIAWGNEFAKTHAEIAPFWNGVLSKEVPG